LAQGKTGVSVIPPWVNLREQTLVISRECRRPDDGKTDRLPKLWVENATTSPLPQRGSGFCGSCGNPLEPEGTLLRAQIRRVLQTELKDQSLVEIEITQAIASPLSEWAKLFGFFVAIPLTVFAFILAFFGWRTFSDLEKTASQVAADVQKVQAQAQDLSTQSGRLNEQFKKLASDGQRYSQLDELVQYRIGLLRGRA
jgi:hypothetical protein